MLSLDDLVKREKDGEKEIESLSEQEKACVIAYCEIVSGQLLNLVAQNKYPVDNVLTNAIRMGMALGLRVSISQSKLEGRV